MRRFRELTDIRDLYRAPDAYYSRWWIIGHSKEAGKWTYTIEGIMDEIKKRPEIVTAQMKRDDGYVLLATKTHQFKP